MDERVYVYGVVGTNQEANPVKNEISSVVYTVGYQDIACVVGKTNMDSFNSMPKEALGRHLVEHQATIEKIMKDYTVIPFKFGTIVAGEDEVKEVLQSGYGDFKEKLQLMDKKIELDLAALWNDLNSVIKKIGEENSQIKTFKEQIAKKPPEETLQDRIKIGSMIRDALDVKKGVLQCEMLDLLKERVSDLQKHELMDDKMILNCAFLLDKDKEEEFDQALGELNTRFDEEINFKCVGPLPPYSFSTIELKKVGHAEIEEARKLLGLDEEVTLSEIKESYRKMALKFHPDSNSADANLRQRFEDITRAYKLASNYCRQAAHSGKCSLKEAEGKDFILIDILKV